MKLKGKRYRKLMVELLTSNLIATRKLCDLIITTDSLGDPESVIPKAVEFRNDVNNSIQEVLKEFDEKKGDVGIGVILEKQKGVIGHKMQVNKWFTTNEPKNISGLKAGV